MPISNMQTNGEWGDDAGIVAFNIYSVQVCINNSFESQGPI